jgi:predicted kinase
MITVLMGAPGAGKTTWVKQNAKDQLVLSSEAVRIYKDELDVGAYMNQMRLKGAQAVKSGQSVIVDATNTITAHRAYWIKISRAYGVDSELVAFNTSLELLLNAQRSREYPAPDHIVKDHFRRFQRALTMIKMEGWKNMKIINRGVGQEL